VVLEEDYSYQDDPADKFEMALFKAIYPSSNPYSRSVIGTVASLKRITNKDMAQFARFYHHVDSSIFIYCNAAIVEKVRSLLEAHITQATASAKPLISWQRRILHSSALQTTYETTNFNTDKTKKPNHIFLSSPNTSQNRNAIVFKGWSAQRKEADVAALLAFCLTGNTNKPLAHEIRERLGLVYSIRAKHVDFQHNGHFVIEWETSAPNSTAIKDRILHLLRRIAKRGFAHFADYKKQYLISYELAKSAPQRYVPFIATKHFYDPDFDEAKWLSWLRSVTEKEVRALLRRLIA
jgi:predicted Zn-dependent peptidase